MGNEQPKNFYRKGISARSRSGKEVARFELESSLLRKLIKYIKITKIINITNYNINYNKNTIIFYCKTKKRGKYEIKINGN